MTNEKKYQTQEERLTGFNHFCRSHKTCRDCPIFRGEHQIAKECALHWLAMDDDKIAKTMPNTPTTPASVASRLTDKCVEMMSDTIKYHNLTKTGKDNAAAVLRDYVRMRNLNGKLKECLSQAYGDKMDTYRMTGNEIRNWGIVLAEAEKGEEK